MKKQSSKSLASTCLPFHEIPLRIDQPEPSPIRIIHRAFTIEIPASVQPDQLTALVRGLV